jgi:glycosyltransferase involved in cell wall biosynthesis
LNLEPLTRHPRISIVSEDLSLPIDEGLKKFVYSIMGPLCRGAELQVLTTEARGRLGDGVRIARANRMMLGPQLRRSLADFRPGGIIYVPRAAGTRNAFLRCRVLRAYQPAARFMMISLQPRSYGPLSRFLVRRLRPDVFAAQSHEVRDHLVSLGLPSIAIPSGVDVTTFSPASPAERSRLRAKYGLEEAAPIVLHVGHLKRERNVLLLEQVKRALGCQAVMVASTSTVAEPEVGRLLRAAGVRVIDTYVDSIVELYRLADCYLFPVWTTGGAIEMPLSVLEAMACGVPVVSTPFGSLPDWLPAGPGLTYAGDDDGLLRQVQSVIQTSDPPPAEQIRSQVMSLSWDSIGARLVDALGLESAPMPQPNPAMPTPAKVPTT